MLRKYRNQILLLITLIVGAAILQLVLSKHYADENQRLEDELMQIHEETMIKIEAGIDVYATVVSSIRAFIENAENFPTEIQLQSFVSDLIRETNFKDSIVVSWLDTNQIFRYVVTPYEIDPGGIKGMDLHQLRPKLEIERLDNLMYEDTISLFNPINLIEGWTAFPFNFSAKNSQGEVMGYIAPVLNVKYLLNYPYKGKNDKFLHKFTVEDTIDITREVVYDGSPIHNKNRDSEYYKNFNTEDTHFITSTVNLYGLELQVGTAYKRTPKIDHSLSYITYGWYGILCISSFIILFQYSSNNRLTKRVTTAHVQLEKKNKQLNENLANIQILIKEIHHRVKNNMQIMTSLMNLQSHHIENKEAKAFMDESKSRIQSMALVHQKLYGNDNLANVNVKEYVDQLLLSIENTLEISSAPPSTNIDIDSDLFFDMDTMIPLGLIINELTTNSFKYAFQQTSDKWIKLSISKNEDEFILLYSDSGPGIPKHINLSESGTLGLELVHILAEQLEGSVQYSNEEVSEFKIAFKQVQK